MDPIILEGNRYTPKVIFDLNNEVFEVTGDSRPEDTHTFYQKLIDWLNQLGKEEVEKPLKFKFALDYINSSSIKYILKLIFCLEELNAKGFNFSIDWFYEKPDVDMKELGEEYSELTKININLISVEI